MEGVRGEYGSERDVPTMWIEAVNSAPASQRAWHTKFSHNTPVKRHKRSRCVCLRQWRHLPRKFVRFPIMPLWAAILCSKPCGRHWPEYVMEGAELGLYLISACAFVVLLEYPTSPVHQALPDPALRRILFGIAMGMAAIGIIYSPPGSTLGRTL
jgi:hypothetical protein